MTIRVALLLSVLLHASVLLIDIDLKTSNTAVKETKVVFIVRLTEGNGTGKDGELADITKFIKEVAPEQLLAEHIQRLKDMECGPDTELN